ncbi:helix-turn-helix transcriptional regulator [Roseomonas terrae]|uniref:Helix-turn-helix transcriptional regulator n=1 Tax=Neoroseomonas terrae TaxID=424799 RepID=A0ABS5EQT3_9PROT|nr:helix-turn-helix transcriptional regulator [Neoroseomonas terrae]MBR0653383.1 helix-turn-helix transcriptional regulator [Neoroseomonas terrae]
MLRRSVTLRDVPRPVKPAPRVFEPASEAKRQAGLRLKAARLALGLSAEKLAEAIGVTRGALTAYENGQNMADPIAMARLMRRFGISMEWIYAGEIRHVRDYEFQELVLGHAAAVGAVVGAPFAEFPMQVDVGVRPPAKAPTKRRAPGATIHESQDPFGEVTGNRR